MERLELNTFKRDIGKGASRKLRREGNVPGTLYGAGREPVSLYVNTRELDKVLTTDAGWNILLDLNVDGKDKVLARVCDYQADVLRRDITHIDFQVIDLKKKIKAEVPIKLIGKAEGVKKGGILEVSRRSLEIRCLPTNIPEHIDIDVSTLDIGQNIHVNDITMPEGVECIADTNFGIATIVEPTAEIVAEVPVEAEAVPEGEEAAAPAEGEEGAKVAEEGKAPAKEGGEPAKKEEQGKQK